MTPSETHTAIDLARICQLQEKPQPFEPGEPLFWTDPHIARQMLASHLDPTVDGASRRPETIERSTNWIATSVGLRPGDCILDLGCGPGLYAERLAQAGFQVTGVDFSQNSIDYAIAQAREKKLPIQYRCQNYLELDDQALYSAVLLIYGDFCPLSPEQRAKLLANVRTALKPGGCFILDVTTPRLPPEARPEKRLVRRRAGFLEARAAPRPGTGLCLPGRSLPRPIHRHRRRRQNQRLPQLVPGLHPRNHPRRTDRRRLRDRKPVGRPDRHALYARLGVDRHRRQKKRLT